MFGCFNSRGWRRGLVANQKPPMNDAQQRVGPERREREYSDA